MGASDSATVSRDELPPQLVRVLEAVAAGFGLESQGPVTIELNFDAGGFQFAWLKQRVRIGDLAGFQKTWDDAFGSLIAELRAA